MLLTTLFAFYSLFSKPVLSLSTLPTPLEVSQSPLALSPTSGIELLEVDVGPALRLDDPSPDVFLESIVNVWGSRTLQDNGQINISDYLAQHSFDVYAKPLSDWSEYGYWSWGQKGGIYNRSRRLEIIQSGGLVQTIDKHVVIVDGSHPSQTNNLSLILTHGFYHNDASGAGVSFNATFIVKPFDSALDERDDWSQFNIQFWSADGARVVDAEWGDFYEAYVGMLSADINQVITGFCAAVLDDATFWGTVKIWTGNQGYGTLGDCECSSSDYYVIEGPSCGGTDITTCPLQ